MPFEKNANSYRREVAARLKGLAAFGPMVDGSLVVVRRRCGNPRREASRSLPDAEGGAQDPLALHSRGPCGGRPTVEPGVSAAEAARGRALRKAAEGRRLRERRKAERALTLAVRGLGTEFLRTMRHLFPPIQ
jgi:hypothetical protein